MDIDYLIKFKNIFIINIVIFFLIVSVKYFIIIVIIIIKISNNIFKKETFFCYVKFLMIDILLKLLFF